MVLMSAVGKGVSAIVSYRVAAGVSRSCSGQLGRAYRRGSGWASRGSWRESPSLLDRIQSAFNPPPCDVGAIRHSATDDATHGG